MLLSQLSTKAQVDDPDDARTHHAAVMRTPMLQDARSVFEDWKHLHQITTGMQGHKLALRCQHGYIKDFSKRKTRMLQK
jgi:hypothetical protein